MDLIEGASNISLKLRHKEKQKRKSLLTIPPAEGTATRSTSDNDEPTSASSTSHPSEGPNKESCHFHCCWIPPGCRGNRIVHKKKLSFLEKLCIGGGHVLNDVCSALWYSYLLIYFQKVNKFSERNAAIILLTGHAVDAVSTPFIGYVEDHYNTGWLCRKGYGRCKSWNLIGTVFIAILFPLILSPCIGCEHSEQWGRVTYYTVFIVIFVIGWSMADLSHFTLIPKMTMDVLIRTEILAIRYAFTVMSFITVFLLTWVILGFQDCEIGPDKAPSFQILVFISVGIGGLFSLLFHLFIMERTDDEIRRDHQNAIAIAGQSLELNVRQNLSETGEDDSNEKVTFDQKSSKTTTSDISSISTNATSELSRSTISASDGIHVGEQPPTQKTQTPMKVLDWLKMKKFYVVATMYTATRLSVNLTQTYIPLYVHETLHLPCSSIATVPLTMYCSGFIVSIFIKLLNKHLGQLLAYAFGAMLCVIGGVLILSVDWNLGIYGVAVLLGGGASAILVTSLAICTDLIGENVESGALVYGTLTFFEKLFCGVAVMIINEIKMLYTDQGFYRRVLGCIAAGFSVIGTLAVICLTRILPRKK